jgi:RNA-directed DNA polymerase
MDVKKFYPSVKNNIMKDMFRKTIKDKECLWLMDAIVDSNQGLPIGNYTSQWFANYFLQGLDHFIKEKCGAKYYVRYVDDLVILGANKRKLHKMRLMVGEYLNSIGLTLKGNWQISKVSKRPIDFLGFKFYYGYTTLRKKNALRIKRRMKKISKKPYLNYKDACAVISYWGWIKRTDSFNFYNKYVKPVVKIHKARKVVSNHAKRNKICNNT